MGFDPCSGGNVTVTVVSTVTNSLCPLSVTRNWLLTGLCGSTHLWTQTVSVTNSSPLGVNACRRTQQFRCSRQRVFRHRSGSFAADQFYLYHRRWLRTRTITQSPVPGTVLGPGGHNITVKFLSAAASPTPATFLSM